MTSETKHPYRTGSIGEFMTWTKRVIKEPALADNGPRQWFDSDATAARALEATPSAEAMVKLLSAENLGLLRLIITSRPASLHELAKLARRKESNLSRTLSKLRAAGIVEFAPGPGRARAPRVTARRVTLELDLVGPESQMVVEGLEPTPA